MYTAHTNIQTYTNVTRLYTAQSNGSQYGEWKMQTNGLKILDYNQEVGGSCAGIIQVWVQVRGRAGLPNHCALIACSPNAVLIFFARGTTKLQKTVGAVCQSNQCLSYAWSTLVQMSGLYDSWCQLSAQ